MRLPASIVDTVTISSTQRSLRRASVLAFGRLWGLLPVAIGHIRKARHRSANVLLGDFTFALADQVDNALMRLQIAVPCRCVLPARENANAGECEKWQQNAAGVLDQMRIS